MAEQDELDEELKEELDGKLGKVELKNSSQSSGGPERSVGIDESSSDDLDAADVEYSQIVALESEVAELKDKYIRSVAEMDNVMKRHTKERSDLIRYAGESLARDIVGVLDDLDRACAQEVSSEAAELLKGISLIRDSLTSVLERHGVVPEDALGKTFNPRHHEALTSVVTEDYEPGQIVEQFRKAYFFRDRLLRPAQVAVAAAPSS